MGQSEMELRFSRDLLEKPHKQGDPRLLPILTGYGHSSVASMPAGGDIVGAVSSCISRESLPTLLTTAAALRMTPRTLQRQLAHLGVKRRG